MKNKIYGRVYMILNLINGKRYIGQTTNSIYTRFRGHVRKTRQKNIRTFNMPIVRAICKYGEHNFAYGEICTASSKEELNKLEAQFILKYNTNDSKYGYNVAIVDLNGSYKHSEITKLKMSEVNKTGIKNLINIQNGKKSRGTKHKNSTSKYNRVRKNKNNWEASIRINNKNIYLGTFSTEIEAAFAKDLAELKYLGDSAILNFPELKEKYLNNEINPVRLTK